MRARATGATSPSRASQYSARQSPSSRAYSGALARCATPDSMPARTYTNLVCLQREATLPETRGGAACCCSHVMLSRCSLAEGMQED